ncbi:MAG: ribonuclease E/G, partial [Eubacterium sp.]|nr:ribonuclease E/G [Eubacterium sp.]
ELLNELRNCLKKDPVPATVVDITKLWLVEITRKKQRKPLAEQFFSG